MASENFKYVVFLVLVLVILGVIYSVFVFQDFVISNIIGIIIVVFFIWLIYKYDFLLQLLDYQRAVVYRFGKVHRVGGPGWAWVWPIIEDYALVDLRVKTIDVPKQNVVTKDGVELRIDAILYLKVKKDNQSVVNSVIEVEDYVDASKQFIVSSLRDVVGSIELSEVISNIEVINAKIKENLEQISKNWGVTVESVEIQDVEIPEAVISAMHEQKAAVQQKLARMERALGQKAEIEAVKDAASHLDDKALAYYYIKAIENMSNSKGSKVFFPSEFSKLAESFTHVTDKMGKAHSKPSNSKLTGSTSTHYKELLREYVDKAVKRAKGKSAKGARKLKKKKK